MVVPPRCRGTVESHQSRSGAGRKNGCTCDGPVLSQSFHEWAGHSIMKSTRARAYYQQQRGRGSDHHAAVRALAFKWIRIIYRCWKDQVAYDENKYLGALVKRGSPLSAVVVPRG